MHRKIILGISITAIIIALSAWSPWLTQSFAETRAVDSFNKSWATVIDGCGTSEKEYGARDYRKVPFGAVVTLDYQCGLVMPGEPPLHTNVYVTFIGTTFGYPKP